MRSVLIGFIFLLFSPFLLFAEVVDYVTVQGRGAENKECQIWYRVPKTYDVDSKNFYRVLVFFGGRNFSGETQTKYENWNKWLDRNQIFLISPSFRNEDYWNPQSWSGKALLEGIDKIKKLYRISDRAILFYGYSAGGQCSNLFPACMPERTRAWVSHASGVFHRPNLKMRGIPALLTCGDADSVRHKINQDFVLSYRKLGVNILWKSFPNRPHDVPNGSTYLAQSFLEYYHKLYACDLDSTKKYPEENKRPLFIGDDLDSVIYPVNSPETKFIEAESKVYFTSKEIADAWLKCATMK